jgi:exopolysaccharide biosynthesis polyprenyl glycosylphosphotransferase
MAMYRTNDSTTNRVHTFINAGAALSILLGAFVAYNWNRMPDGLGAFLETRVTVKNLIVSTAFSFTWILAFRAFGLSKPPGRTSLWKELLSVIKACSVASMVALLFPLTSQSGAFDGRIVACFYAVAVVACFSARIISRVVAAPIAATLARRKDLIIVGSGPRASEFYETLRHRHQFNVLGFVDSPNGHVISAAIRKRMLGSLDDLEGILVNEPVDEVLIALPAKSCYDEIQETIRTCERIGVEAKYRSDLFQVRVAKPRVEPADRAPAVALKFVQDDYRLVVKRCIDLVGSAFGLALLAPVLAGVAAAVKLTSPGPVIFTQERYGLNRRLFPMYKFRTMVPDAEKLQAGLEQYNQAEGPVFKLRNDPRITSIGNFLRKTSLDELPQLWNVFRGDMSLVGPRPLPRRDVSRFDDASLMRRFSVKPGLTCLWQIDGRSDLSFATWIAKDLQYIDDWSLGLDFEILIKTVPAVIAGKGAA